jgi:hypothetical protein
MSNKIPDEKSPLKFELIEKRDEKNHYIGEAETFFGSIINQTGKMIKIMKNGYVLGSFKILVCRKEVKHSFLNYVYGGTEIALMMAIDFTKSNEEHNYHSKDKDQNLYLQAIRNIGEILRYYDTDNQIPAYGFGAKLPPLKNVISHCFSINGNFFDPEMNGLEEVLESKIYDLFL